MPFASVNGARLYYRQQGDGPDIVFLHGAGGNHMVWWQQVAEFARDHRVTTYDARGWGLSEGDMAVGRAAFATDLLALMESLGIDGAHIVAHSMGGRAAAGLARLAPGRVRSFVFSGTAAGAMSDESRRLQAALRERRGNGSLREFALGPGFARQDPGLATLFSQINAMNPPRPAGLLARPPAGYRGSTAALLAATGAPVLFIGGEYDLITSPAMLAEACSLVPGADLAVVEGAGHSAYFERPDAWNTVVRAFVQRVEGHDGELP